MQNLKKILKSANRRHEMMEKTDRGIQHKHSKMMKEVLKSVKSRALESKENN